MANPGGQALSPAKTFFNLDRQAGYPLGPRLGPPAPPKSLARRVRPTLIVRKLGTLRGGRRILLQQLERHRHGALQLRIVALAHRLRVHLHFHVRRDAVVFHVPLSLRTWKWRW